MNFHNHTHKFHQSCLRSYSLSQATNQNHFDECKIAFYQKISPNCRGTRHIQSWLPLSSLGDEYRKKIHRLTFVIDYLAVPYKKMKKKITKTRNTGRLIICQGLPSWSPKVPSSCGTAHAPWIWNMKNEKAITNQIEEMPRDLLIKMNWQPISRRSATNWSTLLKTCGGRKYKVALWPDMGFIATVTTGGRGNFFLVT